MLEAKIKYNAVTPPKKVADWDGHTVRTKRDMKNGFVFIPSGTIMTISGKASKKSLSGCPCECCGIAPQITLKGDRNTILEDVEFIEIAIDEEKFVPLDENDGEHLEIDEMEIGKYYRLSYPGYILIGKLKRKNGVNLFWVTPVIKIGCDSELIDFMDWSSMHDIDIIQNALKEDIERLYQNIEKQGAR